MKISEKSLGPFLIIIPFFLYFVLISQKINLATADLGRHLTNGQIIVQTLSIPKTNYYSYTYADFPFINHHWGSGLVFFLVKSAFGFVGLSVFFTILTLVTLYLFFRLAVKRAGLTLAILTSLFLLPVLASRVEIRPELFTYLLCGVFWTILQKPSWRWLLLLPILQAIWVNLHIYFFLGLALIAFFWLESFFKLVANKDEVEWPHLKKLSALFILALLATLLNPAGLKGVVYPLQIFSQYGYRLFENQSVWFLERVVNYPPAFYFKIAFFFLVASWVVLLVARRSQLSLVNLLLCLFFSYLAWTAVRNFTLFGYFAFPIMAMNLRGLIKGKIKNEAVVTLVILLSFFLFFLNPNYWRQRVEFGFGLKGDAGKAAEFFNQEKIRGPIFNNYDIGSYLIYYLFPTEKVFIDNRPEAYPQEFFQEVYIPMQEEEEKWGQIDEQYRFNTIFFYRHDLTPWAQKFLINRLADAAWAPVFVDDYSIILVKRSKVNEALIEKYELPKELFRVTPVKG